MSTATEPDYPVGPEWQELPGEYDLRACTEEDRLILTLHRLRTGLPVDDENAAPETVCRRYVTTNLGERDLATRQTPCVLGEFFVDTWRHVSADTVDGVVAALMVQEPDLAPYREWVATAAAEMVQEADR